MGAELIEAAYSIERLEVDLITDGKRFLVPRFFDIDFFVSHRG
jgi:hypothetical protein